MFIGLHAIRWAHPPVSGLRGYIAPDADIEEVLEGLAPPTQSAQPSVPMQVEEQETQVNEQESEQRRRHLTGQSQTGSSGVNIPDIPEDEEPTLIGPELEVWQGKITKRQQRELLQITKPQETESGEHNNSVINREVLTPRDSSTPKAENKKEKKRRKRSRTEDEGTDTDSSTGSSSASSRRDSASDLD